MHTIGAEYLMGMETSLTSVGVFALLGLGLLFGLKHATEVDHVVAVSAIVSEQRNVFRSALVGGLWGAGHTASLVVVGVLVLVFRVAIPPEVGRWLELIVAVMIVGLGVLAVIRVSRKRASVHLHRHSHDGQSHVHIHFHEQGTRHTGHSSSHSHAILRIGFKPLLVGTIHGLAGSGVLTLLVMTEIESVSLGLLYLVIFGVGSAVGMLLMSSLIGLWFVLSAGRLAGINDGLQTLAGGLSIAFGLWYAYQTGMAIWSGGA